jgi:hypothetical protein
MWRRARGLLPTHGFLASRRARRLNLRPPSDEGNNISKPLRNIIQDPIK